MPSEVIIQGADEYGALDACVSYFDLPVERSCRISVISADAQMRDDLVRGLRQAFEPATAPGGCSGRAGGGALTGCRAHGRPDLVQLAVVAVNGAQAPPPSLEATIQGFLAQPGATALSVLPWGATPASCVPASALPYQAVRYRSSVREAVNDVLAGAGLEPEERRAFVSYSHHDEQYALELVEALSDERFQVFLDSRAIPPASLWEEVLRDALVDAALVVVVETPNAAGSDWVKREIGLAQARGAAVIAVQPGGPYPFRYVAARFVGQPRNAGPFVAEQHRILVANQREIRVRSLVARLTRAGVAVHRDGASVVTPTQLIGVYPRPVTVRELRRTAEAAVRASLSTVTYSPEPVLRVKQEDRRWVHAQAPATAVGDGRLSVSAAGQLQP